MKSLGFLWIRVASKDGGLGHKSGCGVNGLGESGEPVFAGRAPTRAARVAIHSTLHGVVFAILCLDPQNLRMCAAGAHPAIAIPASSISLAKPCSTTVLRPRCLAA